MKFKHIIFTFALTALFILACQRLQGPDQGSLEIILQFTENSAVSPEEPGKGNDARAVQALTSVHCEVKKSGSIIWNGYLTLEGDYFTADISLDAGSGYSVSIECYIGAQIAYTGSQTNITITAGETTTKTIPLQVTIPAAPSNLQIVNVTNNSVDMRWNDNSVNEDGFKIERRRGTSGSFSQIHTVGVGVESYPDSGLNENTTYYYRIRAYNSAGNSGYSDTASATTNLSIPNAPSNLQATAFSTSQISLSWTDNSDNEDGFKIERRRGTSGSFSQIHTVGVGVESYPDSGLNENTTYYYRVRAYNSEGNSGYSNTANATTNLSIPAPPSNLQAQVVSTSQINLSWDDNSVNETGFKIERKTGISGIFSQIAPVGANVVSYQNTGLDENTTYYYRVRAYNSAGNSSYSNIDSNTTFSFVEWEKTFGGSDYEYGYSVQQTTDGGYIIAGGTGPYGALCDVYLIKTDANGNKTWDRTFGGSSNDEGYSVQQTTDGGYIIVGETESYGAGEKDVYLIKTDATGNEQWYRTFGGNSWDYGESVKQTTDGGYIIAGYTQSFPFGGDGYLIKTDAVGDTMWTRIHRGEGYDHFYSVHQTTDGGYIIAGETSSFGAGLHDVYLMKTYANGNEQWHRTFGGSDDDRGYSIQQTTDGGYIIAGNTESYGAGSYDVYLIKTNASGIEQWHRTFGGSDNDRGYSVQQITDGGYIIAGYTWSYGAGWSDVYLIKTDAVGDTIWTRTFGEIGYDEGRSVQQTTDGGYIIGGYTWYYGQCFDDVYLIKTRANP